MILVGKLLDIQTPPRWYTTLSGLWPWSISWKEKNPSETVSTGCLTISPTTKVIRTRYSSSVQTEQLLCSEILQSLSLILWPPHKLWVTLCHPLITAWASADTVQSCFLRSRNMSNLEPFTSKQFLMSLSAVVGFFFSFKCKLPGF